MEKKKSAGKITAAVIAVIAATAVICLSGYNYIKNDISGHRNTQTQYNLIIESSDFEYQVGEKLAQNGIIKNDTVWCWWMDKNYPDFTYINGEYLLSSDMSYDDIAQKLQDPDVSHRSVSVCIPEGYNVFDIAETMEENGICTKDSFLQECKSADSYKEEFEFLSSIPDDALIAYELEGFLFPATYDLSENTEAQEVVREMLYAFDNRITDGWTDYCNENGITLFELVNLASIVEKETLGEGVARDIASVFINRLNAGQKLQSDVTIFYGNELRENGESDETVFSYNTYKCAALPSGPVCCPGEENINAVINHNDTDYYYFFSDLENQFHFAKDYEEFESLKQQYPWE